MTRHAHRTILAAASVWLLCGADAFANRVCKGEQVDYRGRCVDPDDVPRPPPKPVSTTRLSVTWIPIKGGTFAMGSPHGDSDEVDPQRVTVASFEAARSEVTIAQYRACVRAGKCKLPEDGLRCNWGIPDKDDHPVNCIDMDRARQFAHFVGGRLPTEAEWEFMARSRARFHSYPWGDGDLGCHRARFDGCGEDEGTAPVCSTVSGHSQQGLCDLAGNVWEWVVGGLVHHRGEAVIRGAGWATKAGAVRMSNRDWRELDNPRWDIGFRPVRGGGH